MLQTDNLRRSALVLVSIGLAWNLVEVVIAFWAGARVGSVALFAFGLDSIIELFAGGVLVWRLMQEGEGHEDEAAERRAQRLVGITFFVLAGYVGLHAVVSLGGWLAEPQPSLAGIGIAVSSAVVMSILYVAKMRIATRMQSRALRAEAVESLFCDLQDLAILVGLGLNFLLSWWWADPVAALLLIPFFIKEGMENISGHHDHDDEHEREPAGQSALVCFCLRCWYGLTTCRVACCRA